MRNPFPPKWKPTWSCLDETQLAAYVDGRQAPGDRARSERHLSKCAACRNAVAVLLRSEHEPSAAVPPAWLARVRDLGEPQPRRAGAWGWAAVTTALVAGALALTFAYRPVPKPQVAVSRPVAIPENATQPKTSEQVRKLTVPSVDLAVLSPAEGQTISEDAQLHWQTVPSALDYEIRILNVAGDTVWKSRTTGDQVQLPRGGSLRAGEKYFVLISANLPNGKTVRAHAVAFNLRAE